MPMAEAAVIGTFRHRDRGHTRIRREHFDAMKDGAIVANSATSTSKSIRALE